MADLANPHNSNPAPQPRRPTTAMSPTSTTSTTEPPPALATSKRKFHKLLENITRPTKRTHDASSSLIDRPTKRIRLDPTNPSKQPTAEDLRAEAHARVEAQILRRRLHPTRPSSARSRKGAKAESTPVKEPNYNPWSYPGFLRRLQTFSNVRLWSSKPDAINEVAWAKRGWVCLELNTVACKGGCEVRVVVSLRPELKDEEGRELEGSEDMSVDVSDELVRRIEDLIVQGHEEGCLWRDAACKDDVYRLPIARQGVWEEELRARYAAFSKAEGQLPQISDVESVVDVAQLARSLPPNFTQADVPDSTTDDPKEATDLPHAAPPQANTSLNDTALAFALHGWALSEDSTPDYPLATCSACFRRLGLWLFTQADRSESTPQNEGAIQSEETNHSEASSNDTTDTPRLDLSSQHRTYCPWINGTSQHMSGSLVGLSGIQVLARCIENEARFREGGLTSHPTTSRPGTPAGTVADGATDISDGFGLRNGESIREGEPQPRQSREELRAERQRVQEVQVKEDKERFAKLRALTKTLKLKGLGLKLRGKQFN